MAKGNKMLCPDCGVEMNQHALKIDYAAEDVDGFDPDLGGVPEEVHSCPRCGKTHARRGPLKPELA
ncbi:MAG TPA: hypothetical protein VF791_01520 [Pyrinomonadaceae bacterium]